MVCYALLTIAIWTGEKAQDSRVFCIGLRGAANATARSSSPAFAPHSRTLEILRFRVAPADASGTGSAHCILTYSPGASASGANLVPDRPNSGGAVIPPERCASHCVHAGHHEP
jgi:hypothetical protein